MARQTSTRKTAKAKVPAIKTATRKRASKSASAGRKKPVESTGSTAASKSAASGRRSKKNSNNKSVIAKPELVTDIASEQEVAEVEEFASQEISVEASPAEATPEVVEVVAAVAVSAVEDDESCVDPNGESSTGNATKQQETKTDSTEQPTENTEAAGTGERTMAAVDEKTEDDGFIVMLDEEPAAAPVSAGESQELAGDDDSFLIMFEDTDVSVGEATVDVDDDGKYTIALPSNIRLTKLDEIKECLLGTMEAKSVALDASRVSGVDTASLQLLWSYTATLDEMNIPFEMTAVSDEFKQSSRLLGLKIGE